MKSRSMNDDIKEFDIFILTPEGKLQKIEWILTDSDYNHYAFNLHHYILKNQYWDNKQWYNERGIKQKLILLPKSIHEQVHQIAIKNLSDEQFLLSYRISRWDLLFNRKFTKY